MQKTDRDPCPEVKIATPEDSAKLQSQRENPLKSLGKFDTANFIGCLHGVNEWQSHWIEQGIVEPRELLEKSRQLPLWTQMLTSVLEAHKKGGNLRDILAFTADLMGEAQTEFKTRERCLEEATAFLADAGGVLGQVETGEIPDQVFRRRDTLRMLGLRAFTEEPIEPVE